MCSLRCVDKRSPALVLDLVTLAKRGWRAGKDAKNE